MCLEEHSLTEDSRSEGFLVLPLLSVDLALSPAHRGYKTQSRKQNHQKVFFGNTSRNRHVSKYFLYTTYVQGSRLRAVLQKLCV